MTAFNAFAAAPAYDKSYGELDATTDSFPAADKGTIVVFITSGTVDGVDVKIREAWKATTTTVEGVGENWERSPSHDYPDSGSGTNDEMNAAPAWIINWNNDDQTDSDNFGQWHDAGQGWYQTDSGSSEAALRSAAIDAAVADAARDFETLAAICSDANRIAGIEYRCAVYQTAGIGGGGAFRWDDAVDKSTADGGIVIDPDKALTLEAQGTGTGTGCFIRQLGDSVSPSFFNSPRNPTNTARPDAVPYIMAAKSAAIAERKMLDFGNEIWHIKTDCDLRDVGVRSYGRFNIPNDTAVVTLGSSSASHYNFEQRLNIIRETGAVRTGPLVRIIGGKSQTISITNCRHIELYTNSDDTSESSIAYGYYNFQRVTNLDIDTNSSPSDSELPQWTNHNTFQLGFVNNVTIGGTYSSNGNKFYGGSFESGSINVENGRDNHFFGVRGENGVSVTFGTNSERNSVELDWLSSGIRIGDTTANVTLTDNGRFNNVHHISDALREIIPIHSASAGMSELQQQAAIHNGFDGGLTFTSTGITQSTNTTVYTSPRVRLFSNQQFAGFEAHGMVSGGVRITVTGYDSSGVEITPTAGDVQYEAGNPVAFGDFHSASGTVAGSSFRVLNTDCAEVQVVVSSSGAGGGLEAESFGFYVSALKAAPGYMELLAHTESLKGIGTAAYQSAAMHAIIADAPEYADDAAAGVGGLTEGDVYVTAAGAVMRKGA